ncbi:hypothetical protein [Rosistilla oblonga]|uniref:hypothetical protein n=1 Tax=Rosistilla oblonga TaxID=2527990 RepID=UPI003A9701ED
MISLSPRTDDGKQSAENYARQTPLIAKAPSDDQTTDRCSNPYNRLLKRGTSSTAVRAIRRRIQSILTIQCIHNKTVNDSQAWLGCRTPGGQKFIQGDIPVACVQSQKTRRLESMQQYKSLSGNSGVAEFAIGDDFIKVGFRTSKTAYRYTNRSAGTFHVTKMQRLAIIGKGLATYIAQNTRRLYDRRE